MSPNGWLSVMEKIWYCPFVWIGRRKDVVIKWFRFRDEFGSYRLLLLRHFRSIFLSQLHGMCDKTIIKVHKLKRNMQNQKQWRGKFSKFYELLNITGTRPENHRWSGKKARVWNAERMQFSNSSSNNSCSLPTDSLPSCTTASVFIVLLNYHLVNVRKT